MSLRINPNDVHQVLIAGTWYEVVDESFDLDAYEYFDPPESYGDGGYLMFGGGRDPLVPSTGFMFRTEIGGNKYEMSGPLTSIQAVLVRETYIYPVSAPTEEEI